MAHFEVQTMADLEDLEVGVGDVAQVAEGPRGRRALCMKVTAIDALGIVWVEDRDESPSARHKDELDA